MQSNDVAAAVGLSPSPCLRRIRRLEASGVITGYAAQVNPAAVGEAFEPLVWVTLDEVTRPSMLAFEEAVRSVGPVTEALRMMGQPDYLLRIAVADADAFEALYIDVLATLPGVKTLTSQHAMKRIKP